ncbi:MAG: hypothetical protein ACYSUT_09055 [Planctomycetota bacterium]|jgi:flagellar basal body rod protein FlgB
MNVKTKTLDNITEVLTRIIEFTERRRDILTHNISDYKNDGYRPMDLPVIEFADCMTDAVAEHVASKRLLLCDRQHVRFGEGGCFDAEPVVDNQAETLLAACKIKHYLQLQIQKLSENLMNNKLAVELLKQKQQRSSL